jgi:hypothetical protein
MIFLMSAIAGARRAYRYDASIFGHAVRAGDEGHHTP